MREFPLERFFARHEFTARHLLCASDTESWTTREILQLEPGAEEKYLGLRLGYRESRGSPELRDTISRLYDTISPDDVLCFAGAQEAIYSFMQVAVQADDRVLVQTPCYTSLAELARGRGARVEAWLGRESEGWAPDPDGLGARLHETRVLVVNSPHNPTGYHFPRETFRAVVARADRAGVRVFSDEVYRFLESEPSLRLPAACDLSPIAVSLGVMSKSFGLAGLRVGWIATRDRRLLDRMAALKDYLSICNSGPSEWLAALALRKREILLERNVALANENRAKLGGFLLRHPKRFRARLSRAGCLAFVGLVKAGSAEAYANQVLDKAGVLLAPGGLFEGDETYFRVGFGRRDFAEGLAAWEAVVC
jgi:aspartate/methionine/tyrosine aminotransferase